MRSRLRIWVCVSLISFSAAFCLWRLEIPRKWEIMPFSSDLSTVSTHLQTSSPPMLCRTNVAPAARSIIEEKSEAQAKGRGPGSFRLTNTAQSIGQLVRNPRAILLENALLDTIGNLALALPEQLQSPGDAGAYIVQSRTTLDNGFRHALSKAGATIISYIPNNAYLVRASTAIIQELQTNPQVVAALPYEPYFKLKPALLKLAVEQTPLPEQTDLNVLLFADAQDGTVASLQQLGAKLLSEYPSPFGPVVKVRPPAYSLAAIAALPGVQQVERSLTRVSANDLSRVAMGVASDSVATNSYLGLTGTNVLVMVNDTGVDQMQPDLTGRVLIDSNPQFPGAGMDVAGHGTHVAGIIAGNGSKSLTVSNASGSVMPPVEKQFRGKAPGARVFATATVTGGGPEPSDSYLQQLAAKTNAFISNNSWTYSDNLYDLAAASYDAAVRDALPTQSGSQPVLFVFPAGNAGELNDYFGGTNEAGGGGNADQILSPGTAKNVITVGAVEQPRNITNEVVYTVDGQSVTKALWQPLTDSNNQVAGYSSRGNVGIGIEGDAGRFKPDVVAPGSFVVSTTSTNWDQRTYYSKLTEGPFLAPALSNLNRSLGPFYRYESGSSVAAAQVSGTLALMQECFESRLGYRPSPALLKAFLINGARSLSGDYDLSSGAQTNHQGWGELNLANSIRRDLTNTTSVKRSVLWSEQSPDSGLMTGEEHTRVLEVTPEGRSRTLRATLAWTDPPANPVAGVKLVNNLDLIVTNLDTGEVFFGNDFAAGRVFSKKWEPTSTGPDDINNVENVFLAGGLGSRYAITVRARNVTVNTVKESGATAQDYALVVTSGDGDQISGLEVESFQTNRTAAFGSTVITNQFPLGTGALGGAVIDQRVGGNAPQSINGYVSLSSPKGQITIGTSNQWRFYVFNNEQAYTNVAFCTFAASSLATADFTSTASSSVSPAVRVEPDIDLYSSRDPALTNLSATAVGEATKSIGRGSAEAIILTNASSGSFYIGVKCESREAAEFGLLAVASEEPFSQVDDQGNFCLRGFPAPASIPDSNPTRPGYAKVFAISEQSVPLRRVIVTNVLSHERPGDMVGSLWHGGKTVVLHNRTADGTLGQGEVIFDDSLEEDIPGARRSDGPGDLSDFAGMDAIGLWVLTEADFVAQKSGTNQAFRIGLEPQGDLAAGVSFDLQPGGCNDQWVPLPQGATNLLIHASLSAGAGPAKVQLCPEGAEPSDCVAAEISAAGDAALSLSIQCDPPLNAGRYRVRTCNEGIEIASVSLAASIHIDPTERPSLHVGSEARIEIADTANASATLAVPYDGKIASVTTGLRIDHPRVSDLAFWLVSPKGTRVLLCENRGADTTAGFGANVIVTNTTPASSSGGPEASTNQLFTGQRAGTIYIDYNMYSLADDMRVYYENRLIFDSGMVTNTGSWTVNYGPGSATTLTLVVNEGGNYDPNTAWDYVVTSTRPGYLYASFVGDAETDATPTKFAPPPFTNGVSSGPGMPADIRFLPEEALDRLVGESTLGEWRLEIEDTRAGPPNGSSALLGWELDFSLQRTIPEPIQLSHGQALTNTVRAGQTRYFEVDVPQWTGFATNLLLFSTSQVKLWFSKTPGQNPPGPDSFLLLDKALSGTVPLSASGEMPRIQPGGRYFLGVQNTGGETATFGLEVDFTVIGLSNNVPIAFSMPAGDLPRYFSVDVSTNALYASFELSALSGNLDLVLKKDLPFPDTLVLDYESLNPGQSDEFIEIDTWSVPVPLAPGRWFVGVFNLEPAAVHAMIVFKESATPPESLHFSKWELTNDQLCLTWNSVAGRDYELLGKTELQDPTWLDATPKISAAGSVTTQCVPLASGLKYFIVREAKPQPIQSIRINSISYDATGVTLSWMGEANAMFQVDWSADARTWSRFTDLLSSPDGNFRFLDDGSQTGGLDQTRLYRVLQVP
jgi:subtilisin-like proprotein convertase family protein